MHLQELQGGSCLPAEEGLAEVLSPRAAGQKSAGTWRRDQECVGLGGKRTLLRMMMVAPAQAAHAPPPSSDDP